MQVVLEGLAYAFSQYSPNEPKEKTKLTDMSKFGKGQKDILDVLKEIREDKEMLENIVKYSDNEEYKKKCPDNFLDWYCAALIQHYSDRFLQLTDDVKLPDFFDAKKEDIQQLGKLLRWLEDMATAVYVKSEFVNQFFLLHGITGIGI